jgi:hypothetical protein
MRMMPRFVVLEVIKVVGALKTPTMMRARSASALQQVSS